MDSSGTDYDIKMRSWHWSDGAHVITADVAYTFSLLKQIDAQGPSGGPDSMPGIVNSLIIVNSAEFRVKLGHPANPTWFIYNELSQLIPLPAHSW